jgi:hypothetical protein
MYVCGGRRIWLSGGVHRVTEGSRVTKCQKIKTQKVVHGQKHRQIRTNSEDLQSDYHLCALDSALTGLQFRPF